MAEALREPTRCSESAQLTAMNAIPPLSRDGATDAQRVLFDRVEATYGRLLAPVTVSAHNAPVLDALLAFERAIARAVRLPARLKLLVDLKVAVLLGCPFCIDIGSHLARERGATAELLAALPDYRDNAAFEPAERAALAAAEAMTRGTGELPDALWAELRIVERRAQLVELFAVIAWENYRSRFNKAAGLEAAGFCSVDQRARAEPSRR